MITGFKQLKISIDNAGKVYVADGENNRIQIFVPATTAATTTNNMINSSSTMTLNNISNQTSNFISN